MALTVKDRVKESTTTTGTSDFVLGGAAAGFQTFSVIGNGNTTYYAAVDQATGDWEVGVGTYSSTGPTLSRDTVLESSNAGSKVSFSSGSKDVFCTYPAERSVYLDAAGSAVSVLDIGTLGVGTANITTANITAGTVSTSPTNSTDLVNKQYVDNIAVQGTYYHSPVKYETASPLTATYNNGSSGVGATLTNSGTLTAFTPDGVVASVGDRILVYRQANQAQNGVYVVTTVGSGSVAWVLTRSSDTNTYGLINPNALGQGDAFFVQAGNTGSGETYICNTVGTITFGTTAITFVQISDTQVYTAGTGLTLSGTEFSITPVGTASTYGSASSVPVFTTNASGQVSSVTNTAIAISAAAVSGLAASATTDTTNATNITSGTLGSARLSGSYTGITGVGTLTAGTWNGSTVGAGYGGTGQSSYTIGDILYADGTSSLAKLADVAAGNALISGGVGTAPAWGKVGLQTHVSGTLQVANGGTGATTLTGYVYGNGTGAMTASTTIPNSATTATSANTASAIVARDASGNFSAGTITASLSGNASSATNATSATTATNLAGGVAGAVPYQSASGTTLFSAAGTSGQVLTSSGTTAPTWTTPAAVNNGTLTMAVSGTGLSGSATFTANQSGNSTFTVTSNATNANTASTIVARDASGNFSAGTITATLSGTATQVSNNLTLATSGTGISGSATFNGASAQTFTVTSNATSANTASTIVARDASGNFSAGTITATLSGNASSATNATYATSAGSATNATYATTATNLSGGTVSATTGSFNGGASLPLTLTTSSAGPWGLSLVRSDLGLSSKVYNSNGNQWYFEHRPSFVGNTPLDSGNYNSYSPTLTGGGASGTWSINVTGSAGSATNATYATSAGSASSATNASYASSAGSAPLLANAGTYIWSASTLPTSYSLGIQTSFVQSANGFQSYGSVMTMNTYSGGGGALQMYVPYSPTYGGTGLQVRFGNYDVSSGNSWTSWKTLLASDNYNSYSPTLTGGGASGTWSINVTGSAGSATNASYATNAGYASSAGSATNATYATSSGYATSAGSATNATYATSAGSATNASNSTYGALGTSGSGGVVHENNQTISSNYTMTSNCNGVSAGPITVNTGVTVTIPTGSSWSIV